MAVTVDFGACAQCGEKNSTAATKCRECGAVLPWVKTKSAKSQAAPITPASSNAPTLPNGRAYVPPAKPDMSLSNWNWAALGVQLFGGLLVLTGIGLRVGGILHYFHYIPFSGYACIVIGGIIWRVGATMD